MHAGELYRKAMHTGTAARRPHSPNRSALHRRSSLAALLPWLLGWGAAAKALDPPELREQLRAEALKLARLLT
jgi:hypothetical protein